MNEERDAAYAGWAVSVGIKPDTSIKIWSQEAWNACAKHYEKRLSLIAETCRFCDKCGSEECSTHAELITKRAAAEKHTRLKIADELEEVRLGTGDMFNAIGDYIKQLREGGEINYGISSKLI